MEDATAQRVMHAQASSRDSIQACAQASMPARGSGRVRNDGKT